MSSIEKLKITGIRSFDNTRSEIIQFYAPLTLIVGYNGSGKTTIIECLKYATMGQLPPNSKGGAFVHDPKLCGEKEVMAQVKLQFKDGNGAKNVVTRSIQLTVKKGTRSQKTLEGNLLIHKDGERTSISARVTDMDKIIPKLLGVSPAVLDYVIFCHQDESLWPMSEPATLKKKFDEIFEAMKYTKAVENLKSLRKTHAEELKSMKVREEDYKSNKDKAERVQRKSEALQAEIEQFRIRETTLGKQVAEALETKHETLAEAAKAHTAVEELKGKSMQAANIEGNIKDLKSYMHEIKETDEWLERELADYDERMIEYKKEEKDYRIKFTELKENASQIFGQMSAKQAERGQREAEKSSYEGNLEARVQLVKEAAGSHGMRGYDGDIDNDQIQDFVGKIKKRAREKDREFENLRKATDAELEQTQAALSELDRRRSSRDQEKKAAKQSIAKNDEKSNDIQRKLNRIPMDEGTKTALENSVKDVQERLRKLTSDFEGAEWDKNLNTERKQLRELKDESARLRNEAYQSSKFADARARLGILQANIKDRQGRLDTMKVTHNDQLVSLLGSGWQIDSLERDYQEVVDQREQAVTDAQKKRDVVLREDSELTFKLNTSRNSLKKKKEEMERCEKVVLDSIFDKQGDRISSVSEYETELQAIEEEKIEKQGELDSVNIVASYYKRSQTVAKDRNHCNLCLRRFADEKEQKAAIDRIQEMIVKRSKIQIEEELKLLKQDLEVANSARSQYNTYQTLSSTEIPTLEKDVLRFEAEKKTIVARLETHDQLVQEAEVTKKDADSLNKAVATIVQYRNELSHLERDIESQTSQQKSLSGSLHSVDEIDRLSTACDEKIRILENRISKLVADEKQAQNAITASEIEGKDIIQKLSTAQHQLETKQGFSVAIEELRENNAQLRNTIRAADADLESLVPQVARAKAQHDDVQQRGRSKEKEIQAEKNSVDQTVHKFGIVEQSIDAYLEDDGPGKLAACDRAIKALEREKQRVDGEISRVTEKGNELKKKIENSEGNRKSIKENQRYRQYLRELKEVQLEIEELNSRNVKDDHAQLSHEAIRAEKHYNLLVAEHREVLGEMRAKDNELARYIDEWEIDYKNATKQYREAHVKVEATKAAIDDLAKYHNALDAAIMKYHSLKMEEINQIAGELWQRTYQGTDVDTIMIRSEPETEGQKRAYNYRVCMVKQDTELDMRGRCSAGQKVLASIIIRLALAECFGVNCGIIALDEPTTNLDTENIKALAESLHAIIEARRSQANFQLIIITHDEGFLTEMKARDFCETYFRVSRDEKQKSIIERQNLDYLLAN
ncbi:putative DNA repair protein RAD50 [Tricladium varicosporioides]|nr:putative DNA repair protein RAD50 [Hymenoscyphus varicosporioides]